MTITRGALLLTAAALFTAVGCTVGEASNICEHRVTYDGRTYAGVSGVDFTAGEKLGSAVVPPCDDTPGDGETDPAETTTAYTVEGKDPAHTIAVGDSPDDLTLMEEVR
jgi:hypothetical protein